MYKQIAYGGQLVVSFKRSLLPDYTRAVELFKKENQKIKLKASFFAYKDSTTIVSGYSSLLLLNEKKDVDLSRFWKILAKLERDKKNEQ